MAEVWAREEKEHGTRGPCREQKTGQSFVRLEGGVEGCHTAAERRGVVQGRGGGGEAGRCLRHTQPEKQ